MDFIPVKIIGSEEEWGDLVLSWATNLATPPGGAYSDDQAWRYAFPDGTQTKQIGTKDVGVVFPDTVQEVIFVRDSLTRRYVRLPDPVMVKAAQQELITEDYSLPLFYSEPPLNCEQAKTPPQKLKLQKERVGDYSIGSCM
jgi:hypothetical protein